MTRHTTTFAALGFGAALALGAGTAGAANWDMPTPYGATNFHTVNIMKFAEDVKKATGGKLVIKVHPGGSLIKHPEIKNAVRNGQVPIGEFLLSRLSNENAVFQVDSIPFLASSYGAARKLWGASRGPIEKALAKQRLKVLYAVPWPPQGLYAKKNVGAVDDLKGVKFRAYNTAMERLAQLSGMVPTQVEVPDIPQAFSTGRVDAMITSPSTGANTKAWDFVSHFHHTQGWLPKNVVVVNARAFAKLPKAQQAALLAAAKAAEKRGWAASQAETEAKIAVMKKNGMTIVTPSATLMTGLKKIGGAMTDEWKKKAGADGAMILKAYSK
ncbi:MAG: TRAP transporter substrate-binding protein [Alphaproteobacteria bacterium]|nr:TRAP transporter substrate-binding protein [Alphaproteobacteria bacterium]